MLVWEPGNGLVLATLKHYSGAVIVGTVNLAINI